jgi:hypothetical protein
MSAICPIQPIIFSPRINDPSLSALTISVVDSNIFSWQSFLGKLPVKIPATSSPFTGNRRSSFGAKIFESLQFLERLQLHALTAEATGSRPSTGSRPH